MDYQFDFSVVWHNWRFLLSGLYLAALLTAVSLALSFPIGAVVALCRISTRWYLNGPAVAYVALFRNTPALVQLIWAYYCLPILFGVDFTAPQACIVALSLSAGAYMGEIGRAGIQSVDKGQTEAAKTVGLTSFQIMRKVIFPQAFRRMIPPIVNEIVTLTKYTSLASVLGVADLTYQAQVLASNTFRPLEIFTFLGLEYLVLCTAISLVASYVERRLAVSGAQ